VGIIMDKLAVSKKLSPLSILLFALVFLSSCASSIDMATSYAVMAKNNQEKGDYDSTILNAKQSTQYNPSYAPGWYWLGVGHYKKGQYDEAITAMNRHISLRSGGIQEQTAYDFLGWAYYWKGRYTEALNTFTSGLAILPSDQKHWIQDVARGRGWAYYQLGKYDEAIKDFEKGIENIVSTNKSGLNDAHTGIGKSFYMKGRYDEAVKNFKKAAGYIEPVEKGKMLDIYNWLGWSEFYFGDFSTAIKSQNTALENFAAGSDISYSRGSYRCKAFAYLGLGDAETAVAMIMKAAETSKQYNPNDDLSLIYYAIGDKEKAWELRGGRGMAGLQVKDYSKGAATGIEVVSVIKDGPAERSSVFPGDIIITLDNGPIINTADFLDKAKKLVPGTTARLKIIRDGVEKYLNLIPDSAETLMETNPAIAHILNKKPVAVTAAIPVVTPSIPAKSYKKSSGVQSDVDNVPNLKKTIKKNAYAIVIGIENYRQKLPKADFAARDAEIMAEYLIHALGYPEENIVTLINEHATNVDMAKYFERWLGNNVEKDSTVFIYYSGHGAPNHKTGDAYLVPYDGDPTFIDQTGYSLKRLYENLNKLQAKEIIVALDSCFSGAGGKSVLAKGARPLVMNMETVMTQSSKIAVLAAASGDQISMTYDEKGHGLFTYFLLKGIKEGNNGLEDLFNYIRPSVEKIARKSYNNEQTPILTAPKKLIDLKLFDK
jgi:tetratricopeptide (TPR) repeat protein